jgi:hypothetical protein
VPAIFFDVVQVARVARECVAMAGRINAASSKLLGLSIGKVPVIALVEDTVSVGASRADRKQIALETSAIRVDIENRGTLK